MPKKSGIMFMMDRTSSVPGNPHSPLAPNQSQPGKASDILKKQQSGFGMQAQRCK